MNVEEYIRYRMESDFAWALKKQRIDFAAKVSNGDFILHYVNDYIRLQEVAASPEFAAILAEP